MKIKDRKENNFLENRTLLPILTTCILILIVSFVSVTKVVISQKQVEINIPPMLNSDFESGNSELNTSERKILSMLHDINPTLHLSEQIETMYTIYYATLRDYFSNMEVDINTYLANKVENKIADLQELMSIENVDDITRMSLDGRNIAITITEQIYKLCGLKIEYSLEGHIGTISNIEGKTIYTYTSPSSQEYLHIEAFLITISIIVTLFCLCLLFAKKNNLFIKDVIYDGFDEERFA
jgi:hypothetical protein